MDTSLLKRTEYLGLAASVVLLVSLALPWYGLTDVPEREIQGAWVCGAGAFECSAWATFGFTKWLFVAAAVAPILMAYFVATDEMGKYPTGEFTMTVGFTVMILVGFVGVVTVPGEGVEFGISLQWGWVLGILAGLMMAVAGAGRSLASGAVGKRKPPATF